HDVLAPRARDGRGLATHPRGAPGGLPRLPEPGTSASIPAGSGVPPPGSGDHTAGPGQLRDRPPDLPRARHLASPGAPQRPPRPVTCQVRGRGTLLPTRRASAHPCAGGTRRRPDPPAKPHPGTRAGRRPGDRPRPGDVLPVGPRASPFAPAGATALA